MAGAMLFLHDGFLFSRLLSRRPFDMRMLKISVGPALGEVTVLLGTIPLAMSVTLTLL